MLILSINRAAPLLLMATLIALISACASKPGIQSKAGEGEASKYAEQRQGAAAAESDSIHIPPVQHDPAVEKIAQNAIADYVRAIQAMKAEKYQQALAQFKTIASLYPQLSGPLLNQGIIHLRQEKFTLAEKLLKQALQVNNTNPYTHNALGLTLREQGKFAEAKQAYQSAINLDPQYARAHFNLGVLAELYIQDLHLALNHFRTYQALQKQQDKTVSNWILDLERRAPAIQLLPSNDVGKNSHPSSTEVN